MPFLRRAEHVVIITAGSAAAFKPSGSEAVTYLAGHGLRAKSLVVPLHRRSEGGALLAAAAGQGVDLLVLGAYTRSRMPRFMG